MKTRFLATIVVATAILAAPALADDAVKRVHCEKGQSLAKALDKARPGDTFLLSGTCRERVTIAVDRITLDGQGSAIIDGGGGGPAEFSAVVTIKNAGGVIIKRLVIRNSPGEGVLARGGASFTLQSAEVHANALTGVAVGDGSTADLVDVNIHHNGFGLDVFTGSSAILRGVIGLAQNAGNGVEINGEAVVEIRGTAVNASNNGGAGIVVGSGQLAIFGFPVSAGSTLDASGNGFAGIIVGGSRMTVYPVATVTASGNGVFGLLLVGSTFLVTLPGGGSTFVIENNAVGINASQGAGVLFQGGKLTVSGNGVGLVGDGAGTLTVLSVPATPSSISGNGFDVDLKFGSRATLDGVTIGSITCDATVLSRGTTVCP